MKTMFFDTETTGLVRRNIPPTDARQPMPMQLGLKLDDHERVERGAMNFMVKSNGDWHVEVPAEKVHGISDEIAQDFGVSLIPAYEVVLDYIDAADIVVAHNAIFDVTVLRRMGQVYAERTGTRYEDPFEDKKVVCTMLAAMNIVKAPPKRNGQWKWPKLEECMQHFFGETIEGAHDALVDVRATARVFYHLVDIGAFQ